MPTAEAAGLRDTLVTYIVDAPTHPEFSPDPADFDDGVILINAGETITCSSNGSPEPTFYWYSLKSILISI